MNSVFVANYNGCLSNNSRCSIKAAAKRWEATYAEANETNHPVALHPATVKCEALDLLYSSDRIFILDADTIVRNDCPSPFETFPDPSRFVAVAVTDRVDPNGSIRRAAVEEWTRMLKLPGVSYLSYDNWRYFNSGVMLVSRAFHYDILKEALSICKVPNDLGWVDQTPLNYAVKKHDCPIIYADETWNCVGCSYPYTPRLGVHIDDVLAGRTQSSITMDRWIYHYAGAPGRERILQIVDWGGDSNYEQSEACAEHMLGSQ